MDSLKFDLITPDTTLFSGEVAQIDIPGTEGEFGVLPNHMNLISTLRTGVIRIYTNKDNVKRVFVAGGIAEVKSDSCAVVTERVADLDKITRSEAEKSLSDAKTALENAIEESEKSEAIKEVEIANALISALS